MTDKLIAVIVGALIGIVPSIINKYFDSKNESKKWIREKEFDRRQKFQAQLASAGKKILTLQSAINWHCYINSKNPAKLNVELIEKYDAELRNLFPEILSELIEIAVINENAFQELDLV